MRGFGKDPVDNSSEYSSVLSISQAAAIIIDHLHREYIQESPSILQKTPQIPAVFSGCFYGSLGRGGGRLGRTDGGLGRVDFVTINRHSAFAAVGAGEQGQLVLFKEGAVSGVE